VVALFDSQQQTWISFQTPLTTRPSHNVKWRHAMWHWSSYIEISPMRWSTQVIVDMMSCHPLLGLPNERLFRLATKPKGWMLDQSTISTTLTMAAV
jgi:hypothetical protein